MLLSDTLQLHTPNLIAVNKLDEQAVHVLALIMEEQSLICTGCPHRLTQ